MLTRTLAASVLPRSGRLRAAMPRGRMLVLRLDQARRRSLLMQERANAARERSTQRYLNGRRS
jgi:hypothetical protein